MRIHKLLLASFLSTVLILPNFGMEEAELQNLVNQNSHNSITILKLEQLESYERKNIQTQLQKYRDLLDPIDAPQRGYAYVPGLCEVFKDGIKLTHGHIKGMYGQPPSPDDIQREQIEILSKVWDMAQHLDQNRLYSLYVHRILDRYLAWIADACNEQEGGLVIRVINDDAWKMFEESLNDPKELQREDASRYLVGELQDKFITKEGENAPHLIVPLYAHPDKSVKSRGLSEKTFVEQYLRYSYPLALASIDIHSRNRTPTKKDPHWGDVNGVIKLYLHDILHEEFFRVFLNRYIDLPILPLLKKLYNVKMVYEARSKNDEITQEKQDEYVRAAKILENALFLMQHEIFASAMFDLKSIKRIRVAFNKEVPNYTFILKQLITDTSNYIFETFEDSRYRSPVGSREYKLDARDWEKILRSSQDPVTGQDFIPTITYDRELSKKRPLPFATVEKTYTDRNGRTETYYVTDVVEADKPDIMYIKDQKNIDGYDKNHRYEKLVDLLSKGWDRFFESVKQFSVPLDDEEIRAIIQS